MKRFYRCAIAALMLMMLVGCAQLTPATNPSTQSAGLKSTQLLVLPDDDETAFFDAISRARTRVWMTMYLATEPRLIDALAAAKRNGAEIRIMLEPNPLGNGANLNRDFLDKALALGAAARQPNPTFRLTHQKSFLVDDLAIISTANITRAALRSNREFTLFVRDSSAVAEMTAAFDADWNRTPFQPATPALVWSPLNSRASWYALFEGAHSNIDLYSEAVLDVRVARELGKATARGVRVRLIAPAPDSNQFNSNATGLDEMQRNGVVVRVLKQPYIHAKAIVVDNARAFIGSVNVSTASLDQNRELGAVLTDEAALARLARVFETDWSKAITRQRLPSNTR